MPNATTTTPRHDPAAIAGMATVAIAAVILSFSALAGLGRLVGFGGGLPLNWLIPLCVDAYGATATRIMVNARYSEHTRRHALVHAAAAIVISVAGNAIYHLIAARVIDVGSAMWALVVAVSVIPPVALGALAHLMALCARDTATARSIAVPTVVPAAVLEDMDGDLDEAADAESHEVIAALRTPPPAAAVPAAVPAEVHEETGVPALPEPYLRAVEVFAEDLAQGKLPPVRRVKTELGCGQDRAKEVRAYLSEYATA